MANVTVIGAQWGDEGKGKVVDWLASRAEVVVRFQGGHNAGHTLVVGNQTFKLSLLPSGLVRGKLGVIGNGVVIDPEALLAEIARVRGQGLVVSPETLRIADNAVLILPVHPALDRAREAAMGVRKIGTTGRGIGAAYEDKGGAAGDPGRRSGRAGDAVGEASTSCWRITTRCWPDWGRPVFEKAPLLARLLELAPEILPYAEPVWERLDTLRRGGKRILFEGAQAVMLDVDHGTYPYVTSSNTVAATAASGSGIGPGAVGFVLGIAKAYCTRVGSGPFPSELDDEVGRLLGERGREFGTVTGRPRRCGWFDAVLVRQAIKVGGIQGLVLTKLDVMDTLPELKICVGYELDGVRLRHLPAAPRAQARVTPIFETMEGWAGTTGGARSWVDLPAQAIKYVRRIEELVEAPVTLLTTGPERDDIVMVRDPFEG